MDESVEYIAEPLLESHLAFAFDRQLLLAELVGELPWAYDVRTGQLSFGDRLRWQAEVLGTESESTGAWQWAWANDESNIPPEQQAASLKLRAFGEEHGIAELTEPLVPLNHASGHDFAAIAVGRGLGRAYYDGATGTTIPAGWNGIASVGTVVPGLHAGWNGIASVGTVVPGLPSLACLVRHRYRGWRSLGASQTSCWNESRRILATQDYPLLRRPG